MTMQPKDFGKLYGQFDLPITRALDCGRFCAPLNGGTPVCCSTEHAIPVVAREEWEFLRNRTELWKRFKAKTADAKAVVAELGRSCVAIECKGAQFCERENRSLACRSFPFYPYLPRGEGIVGLSTYWPFEDRCWVISNQWAVDLPFIRQLIRAYEFLFARDEDEEDAFREQSASARRVFSRWGRAIPILGPKGELLKVPPKSGGKVVPATAEDFPAHGPYRSMQAYRAGIRAEGGEPNGAWLPARRFKASH